MHSIPRQRLLAAALSTAFGLGASAWTGAALAQATQELNAITVTATQDKLPGDAPAPYAGGQVARGARLGMLGNADNMEAPFNITAYTSGLMVNQQARSLADVMANDPAVQMNGPWYFDNFYIRGFAINRQEIGFDGMYGIASAEGNVLQGVERVEVLKGPSTLINGSAPRGAAGGAINLVPKRAADTPLTQLSVAYLSDANIGAHLDVGRRFGPDNAFGARINLAHRAGEVQGDHEKQRASSVSAGLDYRGERLRVSGDFGTSKQMLDGAKSNFYVPGALLPAAPDGKNNVWPAWSYQDKENTFGVLRAEVDATDTLTVGAAYGGARAKRHMISPFGELSAGGDIDFYGSGFAEETDTSSAEASMRLRLASGPLKHQLVVTATRLGSDLTADNPNLADSPRSNLYRPAALPRPADLDLNGPQLPSSSTRMTSYALADTIAMLDQRLLLTVGVRRQHMRVTAFGWQTGAFESAYKKSATTPAAGAVFKVSPRLSLYGNYVEALSQGPVAPLNAVNRNDVFAPIVARQGEAGVKLDLGKLTTSLSAFQIRKPSGFLDAGNVYRIAGQQRNRGLEWQAAGEAGGGVRVLGGLTWTDGVLSKTRNGEFDGKTAAGVPEWVAKFGGEWDLAQVPGLTATARAQHVSAQAFNASNSVEMPGWTRIDLGARYATRIAGRPVVLRGSVENLADRRYWDTVPAYQVVTYAAPRTILLSATIDF
ncbi:TonB-dependent receptor [Massilia rubra]|uniref:TonB-dependent receptor n=1 Tax=Massilia rubra TaxID=2607910 RepID=A0ABX0LFU6_9BURK|nr:TonB-dependent receptor [Massilia rubra]NHZ33473.1 TonB-dependent receptor [Massilia rubra]